MKNQVNALFVLFLLVHVSLVYSQDDAADAGAAPPPPADTPADGGGGAAAPAADGGGGGAASPPTGPKTEYMSPAPWIRICGGGKYIGAASPSKDECPAGYWFKESTKVGCVCGHGVWLFAKGWCDLQAKIVIAYNGSCFNVNKDVKYVRQLGWPNDAFMPFHFVSTSGLEYIQDVPMLSTMFGRATFFHKEYNQHIGAVFRERAVEAMTSRFCMSPEGNVTRTFAMKYFIPKLPFLQKRVCFSYAGQDTGRFEYDVGYDLNEGLALVETPTTPFAKVNSWATEADAKKCASECASPTFFTQNPPRNESMLPDYRDPIYDDYFLEELKTMGWNSSAPIPTEMPEQNCSRVYTLSNKTMDEINEQTYRMTQYNLAALLMDEMVPNVKFIDYKLLQKARKIFDAVCPEEELPSTVLAGMLRMFRVALNESFFHYPFNQLGDDEMTKNIYEILNTCETEAKPMEFEYKGNNGSNSTNATGQCGPKKFIGVSYGFANLNRTIMARMPCHLKSNITDLDLVVETAWKTVMFTHYYCARHFGNSSARFSMFEQKMERFFNRWMQHRWFYPGFSLKAYETVFLNDNLTRFAIAMDRCVAAARAFSVYKKWIQRPVYMKFKGDKLFEEQFDVPDNIAGRTSLDAINPKLNKFNNKAFCLPFWHAPVSNPGVDYKPDGEYKPGCVKYRKEEWETPYKPTTGMSNGWRNTIDIY